MSPSACLRALLVLVLAAGLQYARGKAFAAGQPGPDPADLTPYISVLVDADGTIRTEDLLDRRIQDRFSPADSSKSDLRFSYTNAVVWLRLDVGGSNSGAIERILEVNYAPLAAVDLYGEIDGELVRLAQAGTTRPFHVRDVAHRNPAFLLRVPTMAGARYYVRLTSTSSLIVPARLWSPRAFDRHARLDYAVHAAYLGMAATILAFNLLISIRLREQVYLWYAATVGLFALAIWTQLGLAQQFFWPAASRWPDLMNYLLFSLSLAAMSQFLRLILNTRASAPRSDAALLSAGVILLCSAIILPTTLPGTARLGVITFMGFALLALVVIGLRAAGGSRTAWIVLAAYIALIMGGIITALRGLGLVPTNLLTMHGLQVGSALEMMLLAFALAERFICLRDESMKAQSALVKSRSATLAAQVELIDVLRRSERELEAKVRERTDELQVKNRQLERMSHTDALTGLANRRRFDSVIADEFNRAARTGQPISVAMLDVDWFKQYNDFYGHDAGDECLRQIAAVLANIVGRAGDLAARYGGEEFAIVMPGTDRDAAMAVASRVFAGVRELRLAHGGSPRGQVTLSIGVASATVLDCMNPVRLVQLADQALYASKGSGRSRAMHAQDLSPSAVTAQSAACPYEPFSQAR